MIGERITRHVKLQGVRPLMFDRYPGDNRTELLVYQKMYFEPGTQNLVMPSANLMSFLCAENTKSAVKMFYDSRQYKSVASALLGYVSVDPFLIPITRDGKQITFNEFEKDGFHVHHSVARLNKGVPNPKERPYLDCPWELEFEISVYPNETITEPGVRLLFEKGGIPIGLGTYRGVFGKFVVAEWN